MHEITTALDADGSEIAFYAGEIPAWHQLGTVVGRKMAAQEALEFAHLSGWDVRKVPLWADIRNDAHYDGYGSAALKLPEKYATVFNNPVTRRIQPIGVVGEKYEPIQWEQVAEFGDAILDTMGEAHIDSLGSLTDFKRGFISIKLPQTMVLEGPSGQQDVTEYWLTLFNSFDGSSTFFGIVSTVRVVCANTARVAINGAVSKFSIRHTNGWKDNVAQAREALKLSFKYEEAYEAKVRAELFGVPMTVEEMEGFAVDLAKVNQGETDKTKGNRQKVANSIIKLFVESPTIKGTPIAGTRFGAFNAVTEYEDHYRTGLRGGGKDPDEGTLATVRATRTILNLAQDSDTSLKTAAWKLLTRN